jgi:hypothetical protein
MTDGITTAIRAPRAMARIDAAVTRAGRRGFHTAVVDRFVTLLLRLEGGVALVVGILVYGMASGDWLLLVPMILLPDLSIAGYLRGPVVGAFVYNVFHNWALPGALVAAWLVVGEPALLIAGTVLTAHIGGDRLLGYGLKYPTGFRDTHLGRIGRA